MSTKRSAGTGVPTQGTRRSAATRKVGRLTATKKKDRLKATKKKDRLKATKKKDRSTNLCAFTFADGRQCRTPRCSAHSYLCYFHAQKEAQSLAAQQVGEDISRFLPAKLLTACDLGVAMSRLFCAVAQGQVKPRVASTLAYLAQTMLQSIPIAQDEFIHSFDTNAWRREIRSTFHVPAPPPAPAPHPASQPAPQPPSSSASAPHTPLPPTSAEFFQQVVAGLQTGSSDPSSSSGPSPAPQPPVNCHSACPDLVGERSDRRFRPCRKEPASSVSSSSSSSSDPSLATHHSPLPPALASAQTPAAKPASSPTPQPPVNCHSERSEESASSSNSSLATHHSPLPHNPPPVPPGFGAPANWDVLIPPKPRRRFSRHWQFLE